MKLIVLDADGILSKGETAPFDLSLFERLRTLNQRARAGEPVPAVTLNTGRPAAYVEAVMQAIDGWQPALYENGAGLYFPQGYHFQLTPLLTTERAAALQAVVERLDEAVVRPGKAYWQPGKTVCHTLFANAPLTIAQLMPEVEAVVADISTDFIVTPAGLALNVHPAGIDKGTGLRWLAQVCGVEPADMAGAGDSAGDIDFLRLIGHPAAPVNATDAVKAVVTYTSTRPDTAGLHDILDHWLAVGE